MLTTFGLTVFAWIFFRAESLPHALDYLHGIVSGSWFSIPEVWDGMTAMLVLVFLLVEWIGRRELYAIMGLQGVRSRWIRQTAYAGIIFAIFWFGGKEQAFIYFQF